MNRAIARRTMFERRGDIEVFLDHVGEACSRGEIEVHAFCVMGTHYHLLARSPGGELSIAMQRVQTEYSRWFNRSRRRDGTLVRGRFTSRVVKSLRYRRVLVAYIDRNPVAAGLVPRASQYPYGSARAYAATGPGPSWLARDWVESCVRERLGLQAYEPARYDEVFGELPDSFVRVVEARWRSRVVDDPLDDLVAASPAEILEWMRRKARLADGVPPGLPVVDWGVLQTALREVMRVHTGSWKVAANDRWLPMRVGVARELGGDGLDVIAARECVSTSAVSRQCRVHRRMLTEDDEYARCAGAAADLALRMWRRGKSV